MTEISDTHAKTQQTGKPLIAYRPNATHPIIAQRI
jgi:hypothetical protein